MICYAEYEYWLHRLIGVLNTRLAMLDRQHPLIEESIRDAKGLLRFCQLLQRASTNEAKLLDLMCRMSDMNRKMDDILATWDDG